MEQRRLLATEFGGIDRDVEEAFYQLPGRALNRLLAEYGRRHGSRAEAYARQTFPLWKTGRRRMSGQTARRLLELVPPMLPLDQRLELIRKLRARRIHHRVRCRATPATWRDRVSRAVAEVVEHGRTARLPADLLRLASWLADEDRRDLRPLLLRVEEEQARLRTACLEREFRVLADLAAAVRRHGGRVVHTIELPTGSVVVELQPADSTSPSILRSPPGERTLPMSRHNPSTSLQPLRNRSLLDQDLDELPEDDRRAVRRSILEQRLRLETEARAAEHRFAASVRDMQSVVDLAGALDELDRDFEIQSRFQTASGHTDLKVRHTPDRDLVLTLAGLAALGVLAVLLF